MYRSNKKNLGELEHVDARSIEKCKFKLDKRYAAVSYHIILPIDSFFIV